WVEEALLTASDARVRNYFGSSVAISGDVVVVGAWNDDDTGAASGSAYVFRFDGSHWIEEAKLRASDAAPGEEFGNAVSVSGPVAVIGAKFDATFGTSSGAAYVFRFDGTRWLEEAKLTAGDGAADDVFGWSVSVDGGVAVIGAELKDTPPKSGTGAVYVFQFD